MFESDGNDERASERKRPRSASLLGRARQGTLAPIPIALSALGSSTAEEEGAGDWEELAEDMNRLDDGSYVLRSDLALESSLHVYAEDVVDIDLNGFVLDVADGTNGIVVHSGTLNVYDSAPNASHYYIPHCLPYVYDRDRSGDGIDIQGGCITGALNQLDDTNVYRNTAGGAIFVMPGARLVWHAGNMIGNVSEVRSDNPSVTYPYGDVGAGGACIGAEGADIEIISGKFIGNIARDGEGEGPVAEDGTMRKVVSFGGCILIANSSLTIGEDVSFRFNESDHCGGAIGVIQEQTGSVANNAIVNNGEITANKAKRSGGGIYVLVDCPITNNGAIENNHATGQGGGIYTQRSLVVSNSGRINSNSAAGGGGIYCSDTRTSIANAGAIKMNESTSSGGGIYTEGAVLNTGEIMGNTGTYGGGVRVGGDFGNEEEGKITGNTATASGGAAYLVTGGHNKGAISENNAVNAGGIYTGGYFENIGIVEGNRVTGSAGGVYISKSGSMQNNGDIVDNVSGSIGGGIYNLGTCDNDGLIARNEGQYAGGAYSTASFTNMGNGVIEENTATTAGGGIYTQGKTSNLGRIVGNTSLSNAGGIYLASGSSGSNSGEISSNSAASLGGGICNIAATFFENSGTISYNEAQNGAGAYTQSKTSNTGTISNNKASSNGGGVYATATLENTGEIRENTAKFGAGILSFGEAVNAEGGIVAKNVATSSGGGIYSAGRMTNFGVIKENESGTSGGGGIRADSASGATENYGIVSNNKSAGNGGGVCAGGQSFSNYGSITENESPTYGGGVYADGQSFSNYGSIAENESEYAGGGLSFNCAFGENEGSITGNSAKNSGGAILMRTPASDDSRFINREDGIIADNVAVRDGGAINQFTGSTFINAGTIENNASGSNGGAAWLGSNSSFANTGSIIGNVAESGLGGAVCIAHSDKEGYDDMLSSIGGIVSGNVAAIAGAVYAGGIAEITGEITGNKAEGKLAGGGVYVADDAHAVTYLGGKCVISGNVSGEDDEPNNLTVAGASSRIEIKSESPLLIGADVGCTVLSGNGEYAEGVVTDAGYATVHYAVGDSDPNAYFSSDSSKYYVGLTVDNEVVLYVPFALPDSGEDGLAWLTLLGFALVLVSTISVARKLAPDRNKR